MDECFSVRPAIRSYRMSKNVQPSVHAVRSNRPSKMSVRHRTLNNITQYLYLYIYQYNIKYLHY
jgi:hypothetical protein